MLSWIPSNEAHAQQAPSAKGWTGQITLYAWASGVAGDLRPFAGGPTLSFDESLSDVLENVDAAVFITGLARRGDFVVLGDLTYAKSSNDGQIRQGVKASGELRQRSVTLAAGRRVFHDERTVVDVLGGIRAWNVKVKVDVPLAGVSASSSKNVTDPILALRINRRVAPRWTLLGYADVGGFGIGSDLTFQILGTANFQVSDHLYLSAGYRHLHLDYDGGGTLFDGAQSGPIVGATWRF